MNVPLLAVACVLAVGPTDDVPAGRERPAEDHEFYRPAGPAREMSPTLVGTERLAPTAEWVEWVRRWVPGLLP